MLSALASYRTRRRPRIYQGTLAWLVNSQPAFQWSQVSMFKQYHLGCREQAQTHGYQLETFDLAVEGMSPTKVARIFRSRNIEGILLCPQPQPGTRLDFPWSDFAMVTFGYSLVSPALHTAAPAQFRATTETMQKMHALGYRRIGFVHSMITDARADHNFLGGYLTEKLLNGGGVDIPPLDEENLTASSFRKWYRAHKPDAVITGNPRLLGIIAEAGYRVPDDLGVGCPNVPALDGNISGIFEDSFHIGEAAVNFLVGMLHQGIRGIPQKPHHILVPGVWVPGETLTSQIPPRDMPARVKRPDGITR